MEGIVEGKGWLPVLKLFYPALKRRAPTLVYGSQILAVVAGLDVVSKDLDLLCPQATPSRLEEAYFEVSGSERFRMEVITRREPRIRVYTLYFPLPGMQRPVPVEIFTATHLGDPAFIFPEEIVQVKRWGINFLSLTLEAYVLLEATRSEGLRAVAVERLRRVEVDWSRVKELARRLGVVDKVKKAERIVKEFTEEQ